MVEIDNNNSSKRGLELGCSPQVVLTTGALLILGTVVVSWLTREPSAAELASGRLQIERAEAWLPWDVALGIAWRVVAIGAGLALLLGLVAAIRMLIRWLDTRSRLIRPDSSTGQFPAVKVRRGEVVVDLNRLPDGKVMTGVVGGRMGLLLAILLRHVLGRDVPELTEQPAILVAPPDTSAAQIQVTSQAQAVQALAAASRGGTAQQSSQAVRAMLPPRQTAQGLPPLLVERMQPREVQLLLEAGRRQWDEDGGGEVIENTAS